MNSIKELFWVSRPVSWINTAFPFAAAYVVLAGEYTAFLLIATLFFLIPYNFLMYGVNDVYDYESDLKNPRKGGVEGALLDPSLHKLVLVAATVLCLPFMLYMLTQGTVGSKLLLLFVVFMVVAYSAKGLRFKEIPVLDSATSSIHFVGPFAYALSLTGDVMTYWPLIVSFFFWGMASHAFGAVQDVLPDREGGIHSIATIFGARNTVRFAWILYVLAVVILLFQPWPIPLAAVGIALYPISITQYLHITDKTSGQARKGWKRFMWLNILSGFLLTQLLIFGHLLS